MNDKELLKKAIEIAIENGYKLPSVFGMGEPYDSDRFLIFKSYFSHGFAKAFWKDEQLFGHIALPKGSATATRLSHSWEYNLQQMVLEENPIDYLRKFIENKD